MALTDEGSVVLASKDYRLYLYRYMDPPLTTGMIPRVPVTQHAYNHQGGMITASNSQQSMAGGNSFKSSFASLPNTNCTSKGQGECSGCIS